MQDIKTYTHEEHNTTDTEQKKHTPKSSSSASSSPQPPRIENIPMHKRQCISVRPLHAQCCCKGRSRECTMYTQYTQNIPRSSSNDSSRRRVLAFKKGRIIYQPNERTFALTRTSASSSARRRRRQYAQNQNQVIHICPFSHDRNSAMCACVRPHTQQRHTQRRTRSLGW